MTHKTLTQSHVGLRHLTRGVLLASLLVSLLGAPRAWAAGWQLVDSRTMTQDAVATTVYNGRLFLFEVDAWDTNVWYRTFDGSAWSAWASAGAPPPSGTVRTAAVTNHACWYRTNNIAATAYANDGRLYLFAVGTDDTIYANVFNGTRWAGWNHPTYAGSTSPTQCGIATTVYHDYLYLFWVDAAQRINVQGYVGTKDGHSVTWNTTIYDSYTNYAPAATVYNDKIWLFGVGTDYNKIYVKTSVDGTHWVGWQATNISAVLAPPAATPWHGLLYLYNTEGDVYEYISLSLQPSTSWTRGKLVYAGCGGHNTWNSPAVTVFNDRMYRFVNCGTFRAGGYIYMNADDNPSP